MNKIIAMIRRNSTLLVPLLVTVLLAGCGNPSASENSNSADTSSVPKISPSSLNMIEKDFEGVTFSVPDTWNEKSENGLTAYLNDTDTDSAGIGFTVLPYSDDMTWEEAAKQIKEYMVADPNHEVLEDGVSEIDSIPAFYMRTFDNSVYATIYYVDYLEQHVFLQIILTSKNYDSKYDKVYEYILNSIKFPKNDTATAEEKEKLAPESTPVEEPDPNDLPDDNPLKGIADPEEMRDVFDEIDGLMNDAYLNGPLATETDIDKIKALEDELIQQVADKYGLTYDNVRDIYLTTDGLYNYDTSKIQMLFGETEEATINGTTLIVKAKIKAGADNESTINQNYLNVGNIIRYQNGSYFHEIQYWAVADMSDGSEEKVIMFTVPKDVIKKVNNLVITDEQIAEYAEDLWILPSLL